MSRIKDSSQKDKYLFNINDYTVIDKIKKGGFGAIHLVQNKKDKTKYAAKTNKVQNTKQDKLFISREVRILIQVQHPTIIQFRGFSYIDFKGNQNVTILMDYMKNGSLADIIDKEEKSQAPRNYDNTKRQIILIGIARGMMILHNLHIIHRDLKPENILIDDDFYPHITDFGLSKFFDPNHSMNQSFENTGTAAYMAPEVISSNHFNTKADVYSFGILIYEVLTGKRAYMNLLKGKKKITVFQLKNKVCEGFRPTIEKGVMKKSHQLMIEKCWSQNPKERPTFSELYKKLNLSNDDLFFDFDNGLERDVINYEEEEEETESDEFDDSYELNRKFCLKSVDYNEILDYVEDVNVEHTSLNKREVESTNDKNEIKKLKKEIEVLKQSIKNNEQKNTEFENMKKEVDKLQKRTKNQESTISSLKTELDKVKSDNVMIIDQLNKIINDIYGKPSLSVRFSDDPSTGLLSKLKKSVILSAGGKENPEFPLSNILEIEYSYYINFFNYNPKLESDSFIMFDFGPSKEVVLNSYLIRSNNNLPNSNCHPKTWRIEGSNDKENWALIDRRENSNYLNEKHKQYNFICKYKDLKINERKFQYIKYVQEDSWLAGAPHRIYITYFELFGDVYEK